MHNNESKCSGVWRNVKKRPDGGEEKFVTPVSYNNYSVLKCRHKFVLDLEAGLLH